MNLESIQLRFLTALVVLVSSDGDIEKRLFIAWRTTLSACSPADLPKQLPKQLREEFKSIHHELAHWKGGVQVMGSERARHLAQRTVAMYNTITAAYWAEFRAVEMRKSRPGIPQKGAG